MTGNSYITGFYFHPDHTETPAFEAILAEYLERQIPCYEIDTAARRRLSDTVSSPGIFASLEMKKPEFSETDFAEDVLLVAVENLADPGNLGTIIRTADWFGATALLLGTGTVDCYNPKVVRATMGSLFHLPIFNNLNLTELLPELRCQKFTSYAAVLDGDPLPATPGTGRRILVLGSESHGISPELAQHCDFLVRIPGRGPAESLNVSVAAGVLLYHFQENVREV
ncbi:RNA methyltransferase [bacterium]|nr:RNA methyltransferase [bacterium]